MTQIHGGRTEIHLRPLQFALAVELDRQLMRSTALCTWAALLTDEADELRLEATHLRYRARMLAKDVVEPP